MRIREEEESGRRGENNDDEEDWWKRLERGKAEYGIKRKKKMG